MSLHGDILVQNLQFKTLTLKYILINFYHENVKILCLFFASFSFSFTYFSSERTQAGLIDFKIGQEITKLSDIISGYLFIQFALSEHDDKGKSEKIYHTSNPTPLYEIYGSPDGVVVNLPVGPDKGLKFIVKRFTDYESWLYHITTCMFKPMHILGKDCNYLGLQIGKLY